MLTNVFSCKRIEYCLKNDLIGTDRNDENFLKFSSEKRYGDCKDMASILDPETLLAQPAHAGQDGGVDVHRVGDQLL